MVCTRFFIQIDAVKQNTFRNSCESVKIKIIIIMKAKIYWEEWVYMKTILLGVNHYDWRIRLNLMIIMYYA